MEIKVKHRFREAVNPMDIEYEDDMREGYRLVSGEQLPRDVYWPSWKVDKSRELAFSLALKNPVANRMSKIPQEFIAGGQGITYVARNKAVKRVLDDFWENPALVHAAVRYAAWARGKRIEVVATNSTSLYFVARWMEQLFPESEGHKGHGLWVSPSLYSEKLHANGQMVQQGERNIIETFLLLENHDNTIDIPKDKENLDGLNFLPDSDKDMNFVNRKVIEGPAYAHYVGGVPNMTIEIPGRNAYNLGQIYYMMERSVAISGYLFGHNPFIQPGVEAYKKAMFALVGKPGFEENARKMDENIKKMERIKIDA